MTSFSVPQNEVTVGQTGQYQTLNAALAHLVSLADRYAATIRILDDGWTMQEQVIIDHGLDLSWVTIKSDQAVTPISRQHITQRTDQLPEFLGTIGAWSAAFMASQRSKLPIIDCVFQMDTSGTDTGQGGAFARDGSEMYFAPYAGIWHTAGSGAFVMQGARLYATRSDFRFNGYNTQGDGKSALRAEHCAEIHANLATVQDAHNIGIEILGASRSSLRDMTIARCGKEGVGIGGVSSVHMRGVNIEDCGESAIYAGEGCIVRVLNQTLQRCKNGIYAVEGSRVNGTNVAIKDCSNVGTRSFGVDSLIRLVASTVENSGSHNVQSGYGGKTDFATSKSLNAGGHDLYASSAGEIFLNGWIETTSGNTWQDNLADSNVGQFGDYTPDKSRIYGRG